MAIFTNYVIHPFRTLGEPFQSGTELATWAGKRALASELQTFSVYRSFIRLFYFHWGQKGKIEIKNLALKFVLPMYVASF